MEKRTLVKSGASSFTLALPIDWVRNNKLDKGSEITIDENEVGELVLSSPIKNEPTPNKEVFSIKVNEDNKDILYWHLLRAYLRNYPTIILEGENVLINSNKLLTKLDNFIGLSVMEQNKSYIVLKNYSVLDNDTSPHLLIRKIDVGVRAMFDLINNFFSEGFHKEDLYELELQNEYNNRLFLLAIKLISNIIDNPRQMKTFKTSYRELVNEHNYATTLKQLSLNLVQIGKTFLYLEKTGKQAIHLKSIYLEIFEKYKIVMSVPRNPLSNDLFLSLHKSELNLNKWKTHIGELKNPYILEFILYAINANSLLDELIIETID